MVWYGMVRYGGNAPFLSRRCLLFLKWRAHREGGAYAGRDVHAVLHHWPHFLVLIAFHPVIIKAEVKGDALHLSSLLGRIFSYWLRSIP